MSDFDKEDFVAAVHQMVKTVPYGRAISYGAIARADRLSEYVEDGRQGNGELFGGRCSCLPGSEQSGSVIRQRCFQYADRDAGKVGRRRHTGRKQPYQRLEEGFLESAG